MEENYYINFDYTNPQNDLENSASYYVDGTIDIKLSLMTMKEKLMKNIQIIDELLKECYNIDDVIFYNTNKIEIKISSDEARNRLIEANAISNRNENEFSEEQPETHNYRFNLINRLISRSRDNDENNSESDDDNDDFLFIDNRCFLQLLQDLNMEYNMRIQ
jgi:hypothetical protein